MFPEDELLAHPATSARTAAAPAAPRPNLPIPKADICDLTSDRKHPNGCIYARDTLVARSRFIRGQKFSYLSVLVRLAEQRDYVARIRAAAHAADKLELYARSITDIQQRLAPVFLALRDAAVTDQECSDLWREISTRRAANMRLFAADLRGTGELRVDLSDDQVADIIWSMNAAEYWVLLVHQRSWSPDQFANWLSDAWTRSLLARGRPDPARFPINMVPDVDHERLPASLWASTTTPRWPTPRW